MSGNAPRTVKPQPPAPPPARDRGAVFSKYFVEIFYLLALGVCLYVYHGISSSWFFNDDFRWIRQARYEMQPSNLLTFQVIGFFRPLMNAVFYLTERIMPGNVSAYYGTNLVLHFFNGALVFHFLWRLFGSRMMAAGAALFFLITCTHWAAVGWISARTSLISTGLMISSLIVVLGQPPDRWRRWLSLGLYVLALAAKEEVVIGVLLLVLIHVFRPAGGNLLPDRRTIAYFAVATIAYVVVRTLVIGHVTQDNWSPGLHVLRNLSGGFLYQIYPWGFATMFGVGYIIKPPTHAVWPEILALPVIVVMLVAARWLGRTREVRFGLAWLFIALLPVSLFRFRFFHTDWLTHDRYYYLSSIGSSLCVAALLAGLWHVTRWRKAMRTCVVVTIVVIALGEPAAVANRLGRFQRMTRNYRLLLELVTRRMEQHPGLTTCAIEGWPVQKSVMSDMFRLERPDWNVVSVASKEDAAAHKPCVWVKFLVEPERVGTRAELIR